MTTTSGTAIQEHSQLQKGKNNMTAPNQNGALAARAGGQVQQRQPAGLKEYLSQYSGAITRALPSQIGADRFKRICYTALTGNKALEKCTPQSFVTAVLRVAQLGLEPNTPLGQAYLIPYGGKVTLQVGYKGLIELAYRSQKITAIEAREIRQNDEFEYQLGIHPNLIHKPPFGKDRGPVIGYYAYFTTTNGAISFEVATVEEMKAFAQRHSASFSKSDSPWQNFFDEMAKKTMIKRVLKYAPLSVELAQAVAIDGTAKNTDLENITEIDMDLVMDADYTEEPQRSEEGPKNEG